METRFTEFRKTLEARWQTDWPSGGSFSNLQKAMSSALAAVVKLQAYNIGERESGQFSLKGLRDKSRTMARSETVPSLRRASLTVEMIKSQLVRSRAALTEPKIDPADTAGALLRIELRSWMRTQTPGNLMQELLKDDADPKLVVAATETTPGLAGLTSDMQEKVKAQLVIRTRSAELKQFEMLEEAIDLAEAGVNTSIVQLSQETEFPQQHLDDFHKWMADISADIDREFEKESRAAVLPTTESPTIADTSGSTEWLDELFAKNFPQVYPNHPINRPST